MRRLSSERLRGMQVGHGKAVLNKGPCIIVIAYPLWIEREVAFLNRDSSLINGFRKMAIFLNFQCVFILS